MTHTRGLLLQASDPIVDDQGRPTLPFQRKWQETISPRANVVEQLTSRTTAVDIDASAGQITLVSAAGSASWQTLTVTNENVRASDIPYVVQMSGTDKYLIHVTAVADGSFGVTFATTGGTTTEQPVFAFEIRPVEEP